MIRHESVVTALIGAVLGIAVGLFLAGLATAALSGEGLRFAVPVGSLAAFTTRRRGRSPGRDGPGTPGRAPRRPEGAAVRVVTRRRRPIVARKDPAAVGRAGLAGFR